MTKAKTASNVKAINAQKAIVSAIETRIQNVDKTAKDKNGEINQAKNLKTEISFYTLPVIEHALSLDIDLDKLAKSIAVYDKKNNDFIAIYALQKIRKMLQALAQGIASSADGYSHTMLFNLLHGQQNTKTAYASLSRSIEFTETDIQMTIKKRYNCAAKTAETQASSTRMMFMFLNVASVTKNKINDVFSLNENAVTKRMREVFIKDVELKTDKK